jgi:hypothetical protein
MAMQIENASRMVTVDPQTGDPNDDVKRVGRREKMQQ